MFNHLLPHGRSLRHILPHFASFYATFCLILPHFTVFQVAVYLPHVFGGTPDDIKYWPVFAACIAQGVANAGIGPLSYELAAEIAYPVGEEVRFSYC